MRKRYNSSIVLLLLIFVLVLSACSSTSGSGGKAEAKTKVTMVQAAHLLVFAPIYVAQEKGYFEEEGIDLEITMLKSASTAVNAVVGGSADFGAVTSINFAQAVDKNLPLMAVFNLNNRLTSDVIFREDLAKEMGLNRDIPLEERYKALKGLVIGVPNPGSYADLFIRYLLDKAGLNPDTDVQIVNISDNYFQAMQAKRIDVTVVSPPVGQHIENSGVGTIVISNTLGDIPELTTWANQVLIVQKEFAKKNPETVEKINTALVKALQFIQNEPEEATKLLQEVFPDTPSEVIEIAMDQLEGSFDQDGELSKEIWDTINNFMEGAKMIQKPLDTDEGSFWTNEYLPE